MFIILLLLICCWLCYFYLSIYYNSLIISKTQNHLWILDIYTNVLNLHTEKRLAKNQHVHFRTSSPPCGLMGLRPMHGRSCWGKPIKEKCHSGASSVANPTWGWVRAALQDKWDLIWAPPLTEILNCSHQLAVPIYFIGLIYTPLSPLLLPPLP